MTKEEVEERLSLSHTDTVWIEWCKQVARSRLAKQPPDKVWLDYQEAIRYENAET